MNSVDSGALHVDTGTRPIAGTTTGVCVCVCACACACACMRVFACDYVAQVCSATVQKSLDTPSSHPSFQGGDCNDTDM